MNEDGTPTDLVDLIGRLAEPPLPEPISLAPQTAGWSVLGVFVLSALAYGLWRAWLHWRSNAYRRAALRELASAGEEPAQVATILRRTALAVYPRRKVAGLTGTDWFDFLRATGTFPDEAADALRRAPYALDSRAAGLNMAAEQWIRTHRRPR